MPCSPKDLAIQHYYIRERSSNSRQWEEIAARVLSYSKHNDRWIGVSWDRLLDDARRDHEGRKRRFRERRKAEAKAVEEYYHARAYLTRKYYIRCVLTLGLYAVLARKPTVERPSTPVWRDANDEIPPSIGDVYPYSVCDYVSSGYKELMIDGMLGEVWVQGGWHPYEGWYGDQVFVPTPKLVTYASQT